MTPKQEIEEGFRTATEFWAHIRRLGKGARCVQLMGNHDVRISRSIQEKLPEMLSLARFDHLWQFPGVDTVHDDREEFIYKGVCFLHGYFSQPGKHLRRNQMNTVIGHTHRPWLHYEPIRDKVLWELNVGYLADPSAKQLSYTRQRWTNWTQGVGWIDDLGPRFIAFPGGK
jgi:hypothetical protein